MNLIQTLKHPWVWLCRFRHRCGYGVHSPFAFNLITQVIYQRTPYYGYAELRAEEKRLVSQKGRLWRYESMKVKRLLFRLVNEVQPTTVFDVGTLAASALYLKAAKQGADYTSATSLEDLFLESGVPVDFLYLHDYRHPQLVEEVFKICVSRATSQSLFVVEGIRYSSAMYRLWKQMQQSEQVGVTFELYDVGLLFFDRTKTKQAYIVNF